MGLPHTSYVHLKTPAAVFSQDFSNQNYRISSICTDSTQPICFTHAYWHSRRRSDVLEMQNFGFARMQSNL